MSRKHFEDPAFSSREYPGTPGLSIREYAAIHLMVPDSGNADLDAMILKAITLKTNKSGAFRDPNNTPS